MIICQLCFQEFQNLNFLSKHLKKHNISSKEYYDSYFKKHNLDGICPKCKNPSNFLGLSGYTKYCSIKCSVNSEEFKQQSKQTNKLKYGVEYASQSKEFQNKRKRTSKEKFGCESSNQSDKVKLKKIQTSLKHWGVSNPNQSEEIKNKKIQIWKEKYGFENPMQSKKVQEKAKKTNIDHLGFENPMQSKKVKEKSKQTCLEKYGTEYPFQSEKIRKKSRITCSKKYNVEYFSQTFEFRQFAREQMIASITAGLKDGQTFSPSKGKNEKPFIVDLQINSLYFIDNDARIIGYFPDGYIKELNLVIEYDEPFHNGTWSKKHDSQKDEDYQKIGLVIFRVKEKEWKENKQHIIENFIFITKQLELENELRKS